MALPGFYSQEDQDIYSGGDHFITQAPYRGAYRNVHQTGAVSQTPGASGITNTQAASPYKLPDGSGGDFKGGGLYGNLDTSKTKTFMKNVYVDQGPKKGWQKQAVTGYYNPTLGNWQTLKGKNINHLGLEVPGLFTSIMNKMSGKKFGEPQVGDIMGTFTKDPSGDIEEEEAIAKAAIHRNRVNKIIRTGIYRDDYVPKGPRGDPDTTDPTGDGTTGGTTLGTSRPTTPGGWHPGVGDSGPQGTDTPSGHAGDWGPGAAQGGRIGFKYGLSPYQLFKLKELGYANAASNPGSYGGLGILRDILKLHKYKDGGRIGYKERGFVDPEEPAENIFEIMQDQGIAGGEMVQGDHPFDLRIQELMGKGLSYEDAYDIAEMEFQDLFAEGSEQDQGIAGLV